MLSKGWVFWWSSACWERGEVRALPHALIVMDCQLTELSNEPHSVGVRNPLGAGDGTVVAHREPVFLVVGKGGIPAGAAFEGNEDHVNGLPVPD
jgi:hypothetical protein